VLTSTYEYNWTLSCSYGRKRTATFSMTIKFGNDDGPNFNSFVKCLGLIIAGLTNAAIHYKDGRIRIYSNLNLLHFFKQGTFLLMSTRSINNNNFKFLFSKEVNTFLGNFYWICFFLVTKEWTFNLGSIHF
jgi:hypothetical protein